MIDVRGVRRSPGWSSWRKTGGRGTWCARNPGRLGIRPYARANRAGGAWLPGTIEPGLLVLAQEMTEYAGSDVLAERNRAPPAWNDVPIILMTENPDSLLASVLRQAGQWVIGKPVVANELLAQARRLTRPWLRPSSVVHDDPGPLAPDRLPAVGKLWPHPSRNPARVEGSQRDPGGSIGRSQA